MPEPTLPVRPVVIRLNVDDFRLAAGKLQPRECLFQVRDVETGKPVIIHNGSVNWNEFRQRWILIASESFGSSMLGEVWYAEANTPLGPWAYARKIVTHHKQSFYNPRHHAFFDEHRWLYFEGTYTHSFSGNQERTPRYEYNQIMYRLDLGDDRLTLPVPVYTQSTPAGERLSLAGDRADPTFRHIAFFACDKKFPSSRPVFAKDTAKGMEIYTTIPDTILFHAIPPDGTPPPACAPLFQYTSKDGRKRYLVGETDLPGFERFARPVCYVWPALSP